VKDILGGRGQVVCSCPLGLHASTPVTILVESQRWINLTTTPRAELSKKYPAIGRSSPG
jgi:hypothetical protein